MQGGHSVAKVGSCVSQMHQRKGFSCMDVREARRFGSETREWVRAVGDTIVNEGIPYCRET